MRTTLMVVSFLAFLGGWVIAGFSWLNNGPLPLVWGIAGTGLFFFGAAFESALRQRDRRRLQQGITLNPVAWPPRPGDVRLHVEGVGWRATRPNTQPDQAWTRTEGDGRYYKERP